MDATSLFEPIEFGRLARREVRGFDEPIPAVCYRGADLRSPFPLGGLATGCLELRGDGRLGGCTFLKQAAAGTLLELRPSLTSDEGRVELNADQCDVCVLPHFPVCNMRFSPRDRGASRGGGASGGGGGGDGPVVWLRAFGTMIPGDPEASHTPGVIFEMAVAGEYDGYLCLSIRLGDVDSRKQERITDGAVIGDHVKFQRGPQRGDVMLGWHRCPPGAGCGVGQQLSLSLFAPVKNDTSYRAVFAWHVPEFIDKTGDAHRVHYAHRFRDARAVANHLANHHRELRHRTFAWQSVVYRRETDWIANAVVQSLHVYARQAMWLDESRPDRWYAPLGLFASPSLHESAAPVEPLAHRQHSHLAALLLWPTLERSAIDAFAHYQLRDGEPPACLGLGDSVSMPRYHDAHPLNVSVFILTVHRYLTRTGNDHLLERWWPHVVSALHYGLSLDIDDDGLINEHPHMLRHAGRSCHAYERWRWMGTSAYVAGLWLAALRAVVALAEKADDGDVKQQADAILGRAIEAYRTKLWKGRYFSLFFDDQKGANPICLANQLVGQWACRLAGLAPLFDTETVTQVFKAIEQYTTRSTSYGMVSAGRLPDGVVVRGRYDSARSIVLPEVLCAAMTGMAEDYEHAEQWARRLVWMVHEHAATPFDQPLVHDPETGQPAWGAGAAANLIAWALPIAKAQTSLSAFAQKGWLAEMLDAGA